MKNEITYTEINGINYPNLALPDQPKVNIGKYGQMRLD
ncbi:unknown [Candidatus Colimorpha enterica]|uniref:TnpV protein n=1 Tax=Candidatus Colimorpha enterica TaxID=3083063 RepID=R6TC05_9BACT|nr:unknown [Candidatus Colimorpha enterica]